MDRDSFTEEFIERSKARRDYLNKKLSEINQTPFRKRRTSDSDEKRVHPEVSAHEQVDESPKRQCLDISSEADTENDEDIIENKENCHAENDRHQSNVFVPIHATGMTRGLAALRKPKTLCSADDELHKPLKDDIRLGSEVSSSTELVSKMSHSSNSRFAALAANIRNWNDDSSNSSSYSSSIAVKTACNNIESTSVSPNSSSTSDSISDGSNVVRHKSPAPNQCKTANLKHVSFDLSTGCNNGGGHFLDPQSMSNNGMSVSSPQKQAKSSQEQQESQGFVKSSSKSKLAYDFSPQKKEPNTNIKLPATENNQDARNWNLSNQNSVKLPRKNSSPTKAVAGASSEVKQCPMQTCNQSTVSSISVDSSKDPAELPLSSRRALFEKAFCGGTKKQIENVCESSLSVVQRAALFEKAAKQNSVPTTSSRVHKNLISPMKITTGCSLSPVRNKVQNVELKCVKSPVKPNFLQEAKAVPDSPGIAVGSPAKCQKLTSPLKNLGPHTLLLHDRLNSRPEWQNKDVVVKAKEERENELSNLRSHWEKVSSSSAKSNPEPLPVNDNDLRNPTSNMALLDEEKASSVFIEDESGSLEEIPEESDAGDDNHCSSSGSYSGRESDEGMPSEKRSDSDNDDDYTESTDITGEAVAVCDEMDELLNEALEFTASAPLPTPVKLQQKLQKIISYDSAGPSVSHQPNMEKFASTPKSPSAVPAFASVDVSEEPPLLHTVSFYRRQKQEAKTTPVRSIIRRPQVPSPPSPEADRRLSIKDEIQALQNEVLSQQNIICQACQALNLCHARAEFSGSSEEVEGERLLLIATQKRQACLNEIQRLKTFHREIMEEGNGTLTINDIRLPLKRDFIASQVKEENDMVHYFLCVIRHRAQVVFTQMLSSKDGVHGGCLNFTNHINIKNLPADFSVAFEVYTLQRKKEVLSHDKKYHIRKEYSKLRLTPKGKKADSKLLAPAVSSPGGPCAVRTPSFNLVGFTRFTLKNCDRKACTLEKVPFTSPLEGILQFNLQLHAEHSILEKGFLTMFEDVSGFGAWHRRWCVLDGGDLAFWKYPDDEKKKEPLGIIDLTQCITSEVRLVSRDVCARPHTFQLLTVRPQEKGDKNTLISRSVNTLTTTKHLLSADTKEERILWCQKLNDALTNVRKWNPHALRPVEMKMVDK